MKHTRIVVTLQPSNPTAHAWTLWWSSWQWDSFAEVWVVVPCAYMLPCELSSGQRRLMSGCSHLLCSQQKGEQILHDCFGYVGFLLAEVAIFSQMLPWLTTGLMPVGRKSGCGTKHPASEGTLNPAP